MDNCFPELTSKNASELIKQIKGEIVHGKDAEVKEHSSGMRINLYSFKRTFYRTF